MEKNAFYAANASWRFENKTFAKTFDRVEYFKKLREITEAIKARFGERTYIRMFSEPRVKRIYRSKLWHTGGNTDSIIEFVNKRYGKYVIATENIYAPISSGGWHGRNVDICPIPGVFDFREIELVGTSRAVDLNECSIIENFTEKMSEIIDGKGIGIFSKNNGVVDCPGNAGTGTINVEVVYNAVSIIDEIKVRVEKLIKKQEGIVDNTELEWVIADLNALTGN